MPQLTYHPRMLLWLLLPLLLLVALTQLPLNPAATPTPTPTSTLTATSIPPPIPPPGARIKYETQLCWDHSSDAPYFDVENRNTAAGVSSGTTNSGVVCFDFESGSPGDELCVRVYNIHRSSPWDCQTVPAAMTAPPTATPMIIPTLPPIGSVTAIKWYKDEEVLDGITYIFSEAGQLCFEYSGDKSQVDGIHVAYKEGEKKAVSYTIAANKLFESSLLEFCIESMTDDLFNTAITHGLVTCAYPYHGDEKGEATCFTAEINLEPVTMPP